MTGERASTSRRGVLVRGFGMSVGLGCVIAFVGQVLAPVLARLPGLIMCSGDQFELVLRSRTSYGVCADGHVVGYGIVLLVSSIVWSVLLVPLGLLLARWIPDKDTRR